VFDRGAKAGPVHYESPDGRRGWHMWVTPADKKEFLQDRPRVINIQHARITGRKVFGGLINKYSQVA
jgi:hypothetical protein